MSRSVKSLLGVLALVAFIVTVPGCDKGKEGNGVSASDRRSAEPFRIVELGGVMSVHVTGGDSDVVVVTSDENLLQHIETTVEDCVLTIDTDTRIDPESDTHVQILSRDIAGIVINGVGTVTVDNVNTEKFTIETSGAGEVRVSGRAVVVDIRVNGAGDVNTRDLLCQGVAVNVNGAGDVTVYASTLLSATINGVGDITCYGNPQHVERSINGIGEITMADAPATAGH